MTTHENFQQTTSEDADYFVNGRENLWNQLSSELDISNTLGRRMLQTRRRKRRLLIAGCLLFCIGAAVLLPITRSHHKNIPDQFATKPSRKVLTATADSLVVAPVTPAKNDPVNNAPVKTIIIREVRVIDRQQDLTNADSNSRRKLQDFGTLPKQLEPAAYVNPTATPTLKNGSISIDENDIWDVLQTQVDRNYEQQKKNKKDSGKNKKRIDTMPTQINH